MKRIREEGRVPLGPALPLATPFVINVDPASACNFKCKYCFHSREVDEKRYGIMAWPLFKDTVSDLRMFPSKLKTLRLYAFGEPMLNLRFADMIKYAKDMDVCEDVDTTTNGSLLNPRLNREIISSGIDRINISVIGVNSEQYRQFCGKAIDFKKYVDNIADLYNNRDKCVIFVKINGDVISNEDKDKFIEIFSPISDGVAIEHVMDCWCDFKMDGIERNKEVGVYGQPTTYVEVCPYIFYSFCVNYDGEVSACFLDWNRKLIVGNMYGNNLLEIWRGDRMRNLRKLMLLKKRCDINVCKNCNQLIAGQPVNIDHLAEKLLEKYK